MKAELLYYRQRGDKKNRPLIILHGLFGSSKNWQSVALALSEKFHVYILDLRNHGESFHADSHTMADMVYDLDNLIESEKIIAPVLLGHSMGGMVAMQYALKFEDKISSLIVVDIAPKSYAPDYSNEFKALTLDLSKYNNRSEIDDAMRMSLANPAPALRSFFQMNIKKGEQGYFYTLNIEAIMKNKERTVFEAMGLKFTGSTLFIFGTASPFSILDQTDEIMNLRRLFPQAVIESIEGADHWLHHSKKKEFLEIVHQFLTATITAN